MMNSTGFLKFFVTLTCVSAATVLLGACGKQELENVEVKSMTDPYLWMEDVLGEKALDWVRTENARTLSVLEPDPRFQQVEERALGIYNATDKIVYADRYGNEMHDLWRDEKNVRGVWRKTSVEAYAAGNPIWETVLDIDALAEHENRNWVYKGRTCLMSAGRCLVSLSDGGTDSVEMREFDVSKRQFVEGGFTLPNAKQWVAWVDKDTLMIASEFGPDSMNTSGYPRQVRLWDRDTPLSESRLLFEGPPTDAFEFPSVSHREDGTWSMVLQGPDFFTQTLHLVGEDESLTDTATAAGRFIAGLYG